MTAAAGRAIAGCAGVTALAAPRCRVAPAPAAAGTYIVVQCDPLDRGFGDARFDRTDGAYYELTRGCDDGSGALAADRQPGRGAGRRRGPDLAGSPRPGPASSASAPRPTLRDDGGHRARLAFLDAAGNQAGRVAHRQRRARRLRALRGASTASAAPASGRCWSAPTRSAARSRSRRGPRSATSGSRSRTMRRPTVAASGTMLDGGWLRGARTWRRPGPHAVSGCAA